ncbi:hypothetical protein MMC10_002972 [Thelotrema lepadinum]|nr:hypothetical protein [Thelotrema lepadinum]
MSHTEKVGAISLTDQEEISTSATISSSSIVRFFRIAWLLQKDDIKTFTIPAVAFGVLGAFSGSILTTNESPDYLAILMRLPLTFLWILLLCLIFEVANQRLPDSVIEDTFNKPHRAVPSGLITPEQLRQLLLVLILPVLGWSYYLGVGQEASFLMVVVWMYNDLKGGDTIFFIRNFFATLTFGGSYSGTLRVAMGPACAPNDAAYIWIGTMCLIILTTMHIQDYRDEEGDGDKGRMTVPVYFSTTVARLLFALPMAFWMIFIPIYWELPILGWLLCILPGAAPVIHLLLLRGVKHDERAYQLWAVWMVLLYAVPVIRSHPDLLPF